MTGIWKHYNANGKLHQIGEFKDDKQNSVWKFYFDTEEFMGTGTLENDKMIGLWKWYHKNATLYIERLYENGKLMNIQSCFDKNNIPQNCGEIINGNGYLLDHDLYNETDKVEKYE